MSKNYKDYYCFAREHIAKDEKLGEYFVKESDYLEVLDNIYDSLDNILDEYGNNMVSEIALGDVETVLENIRKKLEDLRDEVK